MVATTAVATMAYYGVQERLNAMEHAFDKSQTEIERNAEFRILWPRGELGSLPDDARQDIIIKAIQADLQELSKTQNKVHDLTIRLGVLESECAEEPE